MADIVTNTLQIGSNNLILQDAGARQNIATNTQDISDLKDGLTAVESDVTDLKEDLKSAFNGIALEHKSRNLLNPDNIVVGALNPNNGQIEAEYTQYKTAKVSVSEPGDYTISSPYMYRSLFSWAYVKNGTVYPTNANSYQFSDGPYTVTVPDGATEVWFCYNGNTSAYGAKAQVETGSTATAYEEYYDPYYTLDGQKLSDRSVTKTKTNFFRTHNLYGNLFDAASDAMRTLGAQYLAYSQGGTIHLQSDQYTTNRSALKIPMYPDIESVTFTCNQNIVSYMIYAATDDMHAFAIVQQYNESKRTLNNMTIEIPNGTAYLVMTTNAITTIGTIMCAVGAEPKALEEYNVILGEEIGDLVLDYNNLYNAPEIPVKVNNVKLHAPDTYQLVVGDTFELFYKGIINAVNPDCYYVHASCSSGNAYTKRFIYTPTAAGIKELTLSLYDQNHELLDQKIINLVAVAKASSPATEKVVLCVGDSLTVSGAWPAEVYRRLTANDGNPTGDGLSNITFIGTKQTAGGVKYEGYGGWKFSYYNGDGIDTMFKYITCTHDKTDADQHSIYQDGAGKQWKLETIETGRIKIIAVTGQGTDFPETGTLTWVSGGVNHTDIVYTASENAPGNPFWNSNTNAVDFANYATTQGVSSIDYIYVLLGWNSEWEGESANKSQATTFINNVHAAFPNCKIVLMGLQIPARDGLGVNYTPSSGYSDYYRLMNYVFNLDKWYDELAGDNENVYHINISGQFDTEHNMPSGTRAVNMRNSQTENYQANGIHPATSGYMQIADAVYRDITARLQ